MDDRELLEHIGTTINLKLEHGWYYAAICGVTVRVWDKPCIIIVGMALDQEEAISDALKQLKAMMFKIICMRKNT